MTDKIFGVNIMLMSPYADEVATDRHGLGVKVVTTGAGNPAKYMKAWIRSGHQGDPCGALSRHSPRFVAKRGASAVIAEGGESGGHVGDLTTMVLTPQVCDAVDIPVIAAGGIADGRGIAAALMLGASGCANGDPFPGRRQNALFIQITSSKSSRRRILIPYATGRQARASRTLAQDSFSMEFAKHGIRFFRHQ